jgi:hypothetical protein
MVATSAQGPLLEVTMNRHFSFVAAVAALTGCGSSSVTPPPDAAAAFDGAAPSEAGVGDALASDVAGQHAIVANIALTPDSDGQHVTFATQNGSTVALLTSDLVGKTVYWATTAGGDPVSNAQTIDVNLSTIQPDLTATFKTQAHYPNGPWEVACVISVTGTPPPKIPAAGDLAAFDNTPPPAGDPPDTGDSVRVHVANADATVTLTNRYFIRFGTQ